MTRLTEGSVIVTVTPTIMDGTVVRWYRSMTAYDHDHELASASRNKAIVDEHAPSWLEEAAYSAHQTLRRDNNADMHHLATHRKQSLFGPLVPVQPAYATPARETAAGENS
jgi:hypothetical protein